MHASNLYSPIKRPYIIKFLLFIGDASAVAANGSSLVLSVVDGTACPGGDLKYNCTVTATRVDFELRWKEAMTTTIIAQYVYDSQTSLIAQYHANFKFNATIIPPNYTLTSTATLSGALLSHNNITLECLLQGFNQLSLSDTIVTAGIQKLHD